MDGITKAMVSIEGVSPLLMHNSQLANPASPWVRKIKAITGKHHSKKTESDELALIELEFSAGLYFDEAEGPYIPGVNIEGTIRDAAKTTRQGKAIESGMVVEQDIIPLKYAGPRTIEGLYDNKKFVDTRAVKLQKSATIMRTRPRFDKWAVDFEIMCIDELVSIRDIEKFINIAGMVKGLGDYRPKFGRFIVKDFLII